MQSVRPGRAPLDPIAIVDLMSRTASWRDAMLAAAFVAVLAGSMLIAIRFGATAGPAVAPFVPMCAALWAAADLLTALLLLSQFSVNGMRAYAVLAGAYASSGLLTIPYLWYFPGLFLTSPAPTGLQQVSLWLWVCWHLTFPVLVGGYRVFDNALDARVGSGTAVRRWLAAVVVICVGACAVVAVGVVGFHDRLPDLIAGGHFTALFAQVLAPAVVVINLVAAIAMVSTKRLCRLQLWLGVALTSAAMDGLLNAVASGRYSVSWYVGKLEALAAGVIVLIILLSEISLLYRRLGSLATIDALTGLSNRQAFDSDARFALALRRRGVGQLAFLVIDLDFFKQYNDTYGHQAGDACLQRVTAAIRQTCARSIDLVGRFGGEEFVVLLLDTNAAGALLISEAIRRNVEALEIEHAGSSVAPVVTVSVGVVQTSHENDAQLEALFRRADAALYRAKVRRNVVVMEAADEPVERPIDEEDAVA